MSTTPMKVLFIYPNAHSQLGFNYGVAHLSAVLKAAGHEVSLWHFCEDLAPLPDRDWVTEHLRELAPDVIGFSLVTNQWEYARTLAAWCREATSVPIVCGGIHGTVAADEVLASDLFDAVFRGECEEAFAEFVERVAAGEPWTDVRNLACRVGERTVINPVRSLPDLAALPPKDYSIFRFQEIIDAKHGWVGLMASRGCPFRCTYCFNHAVVRMYSEDLGCSPGKLGYIRYVPVPQLMAEIRSLLECYTGITMFIFDDDLFTFDRDYVQRFCAAYPAVSDLPFVVNGHVGLFDEARAEALASAGCRIVKFGLESGSERIRRDVMHRHMNNGDIIEAVAMVEANGMHSSAFVMFGLPYETMDDIDATIDLLAQARPGRFRWTFFFPFPGTVAHNLSVQGGFINEERMRELSNFTDASCLDFGPAQNLYLRKIGQILPWMVNARIDWPCRRVYAERVNDILTMDEASWQAAAPGLCADDEALSAQMQTKGWSHYAIKYNRFMGVISDYFLNEP